MSRRSYTEEFKREAVALLERSNNKAQVARDLGIHPNLLDKWRSKIRSNPDRPFPWQKENPQDEELAHAEKRKTPASKRRWKY